MGVVDGSMTEKNKRKTGAYFEQKAAEYLAGQGYRILERNHKNRGGEIDIIARDKEMLVFTEVKFRANVCCGDPLEAVDQKKQRRICTAAVYYYKKHGYGMTQPCRFDVIAFYGDGLVRHIQNAFEFRMQHFF